MSAPILLDGNSLTRENVVAIARDGAKVALDASQLARVQRAADFLADKVKCGEPIILTRARQQRTSAREAGGGGRQQQHARQHAPSRRQLLVRP